MATYYIPNESGWAANGGGTYNTYLRVVLTTSYNISTNITAVTAELQIKNSVLTLTWSSINDNYRTFTANGNTWTLDGGYRAQTHSDDAWYTITKTGASAFSYNLTHNADGTAQISVNVNLYMYASLGSGSNVRSWHSIFSNLSGYINLSEPRASSVSASNGTFGSAIPITISRYSSSFTHTITTSCLGQTETVMNKGSSTSVNWTPAIATYAPLMTNSMSTTAVITCTTYSGSTNVGSKSVSITVTLPAASVKPSVSISVSDATTSPKDSSKTCLQYYGAYVATKSKFRIAVTPTLMYGATASSYTITANGQTFSSTPATTSVIQSASSNSITAKVTDSRGQTSSTATTSPTVLAYTTPTITAFKAERCTDSTGSTLSNSGAYMKVSYTISVTSLNSHNSRTLTIKYKQRSASSYTNGPSVTLSSYTASGFVTIAADTNYSYDVRATLTDDFSSVTSDTVLPTGFTMMNFKSGGHGIGIGKVSEINDSVELAPGWELYFGTNTLREHLALRGVAIPSNSDLNNYTTPGEYYIQNASVASTISNNPYTTGNSRLTVLQGGGVEWLTQILIATGNANAFEWRRRYDVANGVWDGWVKMICSGSGPNEVSSIANQSGESIPSNSNLNNYTTPGVFCSESGAITASLSNCPVTGYNFRLDVRLTSGTGYLTQTITSSGYADIYVRACHGGTWTAWARLFNTVTDGYLSTIGTYEGTSPNSVSVPNNTETQIASLSLTAGLWSITCAVRFDPNATGIRRAYFQRGSAGVWVADNTSTNAINGTYTWLNFSNLVNLGATTEIKLFAAQNSGGSLTTYGRIYAARIK